jgi:6-phosphofructokinase
MGRRGWITSRCSCAEMIADILLIGECNAPQRKTQDPTNSFKASPDSH